MSIYCFDLDNTLCVTEYIDGRHHYLEAEPIEKRIKMVNKLYDQGHIIIIESAWGCGSGVNWFQDIGKRLNPEAYQFQMKIAKIMLPVDFYSAWKKISSIP